MRKLWCFYWRLIKAVIFLWLGNTSRGCWVIRWDMRKKVRCDCIRVLLFYLFIFKIYIHLHTHTRCLVLLFIMELYITIGSHACTIKDASLMFEVQKSFLGESFLQGHVSGFPVFVKRFGFGQNKPKYTKRKVNMRTHKRMKSNCLSTYERFIAQIPAV